MKTNEAVDTKQVAKQVSSEGPSSYNRTMQVTTEDGGRLNAFAKEPRMEVMDLQTSRSRGRSSLMMMLGGSLLVAALMAVTVAIS